MVQFKNLPEELAAQLDGLEILALQDPNDSDIVKKLKLDELEKALEVLAKNVQDAAWSPENVVRVVQNLAEDLPGQVYADPQDAIDYIIAAGPPSENDPWVLEFGAGVFDVSGLTVTGVPRLTIRGQSKQINQTWTATPGTRLKVSSGYLFDEISSPVLVSNCHITLDGGTAVLGLSGNGAYFNECAFELGAAGQIYGDTGGANNLFFRCFFEGAAHLLQTHGDTFVDCDFNAATPGEGIRLQTGDTAGRRLFNLIGCRNLPNAATSRPFFDVSNLNDDCAINLIDCEVEPASGGASDYVNAPAGGTTTLTLRKTALGGAQINAAVSVSGQDLTGPFTPSDPPRTVVVDGGAYALTNAGIQAALDYAATQTPSDTNEWTVLVAPSNITGVNLNLYANVTLRAMYPGQTVAGGGYSENYRKTSLVVNSGNGFTPAGSPYESPVVGFRIVVDNAAYITQVGAHLVDCWVGVNQTGLWRGDLAMFGGAMQPVGFGATLDDAFASLDAWSVDFSNGRLVTAGTSAPQFIRLYNCRLNAVPALELNNTHASNKAVIDNCSIKDGVGDFITGSVGALVQVLNTNFSGRTINANVTQQAPAAPTADAELVPKKYANDNDTAPNTSYIPSNGAHWVDPDPTNVQDALDRIAASINADRGPVA